MSLDHGLDIKGQANPDLFLCRIPPFRPAVVKLLHVLADEEVSVPSLVTWIGSDPALCSEILTAANSAVYGPSHRINTIRRAVTMVGLERTKALATRVAIDGMIQGIANHPAVASCWMHSRATAVAGQWLAPLFHMHPDRAYTDGLMHDIGRLGLLLQNTSAYAALLSIADGTDAELLEAERVIFTIDHCEAGLWLTKTWGLPLEIQTVCSQHHTDFSQNLDEGINVVRLACVIAQSLGFKAAPSVRSPTFESLLDRLPGITRSLGGRLETLFKQIERELGRTPLLPPGYPDIQTACGQSS